MLERLTPAARSVVDAAEREARRLGHDAVGSEHLLLALASCDAVAGIDVDLDGLRAALAEAAEDAHGDREALATLGIDLDDVNRRLDERYGAAAPGRNGSRPRRDESLGRALAGARREARAAGTRRVTPEHLLLGVFAGVAPGAGVLLAYGVTPSELRRGSMRP